MGTSVYILSYRFAGQLKVMLSKEQLDYYLSSGDTLKETCIHFAEQLGLDAEDIRDAVM